MAQSSANQAQSSANQAGQMATAAGAGAVVDANAIALVNQRVSDLGDYKTVGEAALFFNSDQSTLSADDKQALTQLASDAKSTQNYMIEIAGYASSTGTKALNQKLSDERATLSLTTCATRPTCRCDAFWLPLATEHRTRPPQTLIPRDETSTGVSM
jgi:outer membrane protein OmpA-like peptidoglycan-associated protein